MTNWDKIHAFVNVSKEYVTEYYGICEGLKGELLPVLCNYTNCNNCIFDNLHDCRKQMEEFLEKEVKTNE